MHATWCSECTGNPHVWNGNTIHVCLPTACSREIPFGFLSTTEATAVHVHSALGSFVHAGYQAMLLVDYIYLLSGEYSSEYLDGSLVTCIYMLPDSCKITPGLAHLWFCIHIYTGDETN